MARNPLILVVEARFYEHIADALAEGACRVLDAAGARYERISVPGAFELPSAIAIAADTGRYDGFVALGCVIRGETSHYDYVCTMSAQGLAELARRERLAIGYGILTTDDEAQALERADVDRKDKGGDAARACLAMVELKQRFGGAR